MVAEKTKLFLKTIEFLVETKVSLNEFNNKHRGINKRVLIVLELMDKLLFTLM